MDKLMIKKHLKGTGLVDVIVAAILIATLAVCLLNLHRYSRSLLPEIKSSTIAVSALDSIMSYLELQATEAGFLVEWPDTGLGFKIFADNSTNTPDLVNLEKLLNGQRIKDVLDQLENWKIEYKIDTHSGTKYKDRSVILRITWQSRRKANDGSYIQKQEALFSVFTSRVW